MLKSKVKSLLLICIRLDITRVNPPEHSVADMIHKGIMCNVSSTNKSRSKIFDFKERDNVKRTRAQVRKGAVMG